MKRTKLKLRYVLILALWIILCIYMKSSLRRLDAERTYFATSLDDSFGWPLFTVCPFFGQRNILESFEDIMEEIKRSKDNFKYANISKHNSYYFKSIFIVGI